MPPVASGTTRHAKFQSSSMIPIRYVRAAKTNMDIVSNNFDIGGTQILYVLILMGVVSRV